MTKHSAEKLRELGWREMTEVGLALTIGPFWRKQSGDDILLGLLTDARHVNRAGAVHGGVMLTLADHVMGFAVADFGGPPHATIQLDLQFVAAVAPGDFLEGRAVIGRRTRSIVFVHAELSVGKRLVAVTSGLWKQLARR
jgi:acyl-coenzyme A thioesterase PaaI-like protein